MVVASHFISLQQAFSLKKFLLSFPFKHFHTSEEQLHQIWTLYDFPFPK